MIATIALACTTTMASEPSSFLTDSGGHRLFRGSMPPGMIAATRQAMAPPMPPYQIPASPYFQPVAFHGPGNMAFALPQANAFGDPQSDLMAGLMVGQVYRFKITGIPGAPGTELFPTIEMVDRTFPPPGLATSYPIPIHIDADDIAAAADGSLVTRVIYLEDPQTAVPLRQPTSGAVPIDVGVVDDPLHTADRLGRVVAILRLGSLAPPRAPALMPGFVFGSPSWAPIYQADTASRGEHP
ncbi:MAG: hypothetical protein AAF539_00340 [Planctomycetota bacterium]